jgi:hypothetical protein
VRRVDQYQRNHLHGISFKSIWPKHYAESNPMKFKTSAWVILIALLIELLGHAAQWSAQYRVRRSLSVEPSAWSARVETTEALDVPQILTDEDSGPVAVSVKDNPDDVVNKAAWSLVADTAHSCVWEGVDPSYRTETLMAVAGQPERVHWSRSVQSGNPPPPNEVIVIGTDQYHRDSDGTWQKDAEDGIRYVVLTNQISMGFWLEALKKNLKLIRRDVIDGSPTFKYEALIHPDRVITSDSIVDIWIGIKDGLPRKYLRRPLQKPLPPRIERDTFTCSYGEVEIEAPI